MRLWLFVLASAVSFLPVHAQDKPGAIKASGKPGGAGIWVDGKYVGPASRFTVAEKYSVEPGDHEVTFRDPRYEDWSTKVTVQAGKTAKIHYKLTPAQLAPPPYGRLRFGGGTADSFISVTAGDTTPVFINDKFYGYIDELNNAGGGLLLPPGTYRVRADSPVHGNINQEVTIEANKVTVIPLRGGK